VQFTVLPVRTRPASPNPRQAFLVRDNWDDYHFKTTFELLCVDSRGEVRNVGPVDLLPYGISMGSGAGRHRSWEHGRWTKEAAWHEST
jgi:hypothetical protein